MVRIHKNDETRHAAILREASARAAAGLDIPRVPADLRVILRIDHHVGGFGAAFESGKAGVMDAYALLQVIEERAVKEFPAIVRALGEVDAASAEVIAGVVRDEERHVKYAKAISREFAPDEAALATTLARYRAGEARAFEEHQRAFLRFAVRHDLLDVRGAERMLWRALAA
jgi:hypothetical protein